MKNIYYFRKICPIGGVEQFFYEIAKKYQDKDLTIYYDIADEYQLQRLKKYVRCKQRIPGEKVKCDRAFFNFNIDMIDDVEAKDYYFVIHAIYEILGYTKEEVLKTSTHPKINHYIGVSQYACNEFEKMTGKKCDVCFNPLTLEPKKKVIKIVSACRLDDAVKGGENTQKLIKALDRYAEEHDRQYLWLLFTNLNTKINIDSKNVVIMKPRVDVRPYIADADFVAQLSLDMETYSYTINEALGYGVPVITTPLTILKELPVNDNMRIQLEYDCSNVDDVARQIFEKDIKPFKYDIPTDGWDKLFAPGESRYKEELRMRYLVEALPEYERLNVDDKDLGRVPTAGEQWEITGERLEVLLGDNSYNTAFVKVVKEIKSDTKPEATEDKPKKKKR